MWVGVVSLSPSWGEGVFGGCGPETHAIQLGYPRFPSPPFCYPSVRPSSAFIPFFSLPRPRSLPHSLSGRAMPEGPGQRVMAAAEAGSTGTFHSESGFCFWGQGAGQGRPHTD